MLHTHTASLPSGFPGKEGSLGIRQALLSQEGCYLFCFLLFDLPDLLPNCDGSQMLPPCLKLGCGGLGSS